MSVHTQLVNRLKDIRDELVRLDEKETLTSDDEVMWNDLTTEFADVDEQRKTLERADDIDRIREIAKDPRNLIRGDSNELDSDPFGDPDSTEGRVSDDPFDLAEMRTWDRSPVQLGEELKARALTAIEDLPGTNDSRREAMTGILQEFDTDKGVLAKRLLLSGSPAYMRAFVKAAKLRDSQWTDEERAAVERAMSLTDTAGGFLIPFQLDPTVINTSDGSLNQIRQAARQVVATGDVWSGISAAETTWSWDAEAAEVSDDASTFAQPAVTVHKASGFIPISVEAAQDEANVAGEVARLLAAGKDTLEAAAFATGSGSGQPFGVVTALDTISASIVTSTTTDTFGSPDVYALDEGLPAKFRVKASWLANRAIYNDVRNFDTTGGAQLWERIGADMPALLLGRPAYESEDMDGVIATTNDYILVFGDFDNYVIADRIGMTVEFIPHLFHTANNLPSGQRGWWAHYRVGADVVNNGAFRLLNST